MKRLIWLFPAVLLIFISNARAQEFPVPVWEIAGGYSYLDANLNGAQFHMNGANGSLTQNLNDWFGGRVEVNAYQGNEPVAVQGQTTIYSVSAQTITYGPVFSYRRIPRITPFGHVQLGAIHGSTEYLGISASAYKFALAPGGGFDFAVNKRTVVRVDGEYLITRFLGLTQNNINVSLGIVFRFGTH
jgi:hypothetical protein